MAGTPQYAPFPLTSYASALLKIQIDSVVIGFGLKVLTAGVQFLAAMLSTSCRAYFGRSPKKGR